MDVGAGIARALPTRARMGSSESMFVFGVYVIETTEVAGMRFLRRETNQAAIRDLYEKASASISLLCVIWPADKINATTKISKAT